MQIYYGVTIDKEASIEIAGRSRGTPRIANRLLKRVADYATVLNNSNISEEIASLALGKLEIDKIGLDNIVLETDSPYLAPVPVRGSVNTSKNIVYIASYLAELLKIPVEDVYSITSNNANFLFDFKK